MREEYSLKALQERIGYTFRNEALLKQAMTHKSYANEMQINKADSYERIEFLGDAVLELITSEFLFRGYTNVQEGELTKMRASMVCEQSLAFCARDLHIGEFVLLGKGEECTGGRSRDSITSDAMEAIIGAIYLDSGMEAAREFVHKFVLNDLEKKQLFLDSKTTLQELAQGKLKKNLEYRLVNEQGPEHDKIFAVQVYLDEELLGEGSGRTKKHAEQQAAYEALLILKERGVRK